MTPRRLLLVSSRYPPHLGGTELHTYEVAHELARRGHEVTVLTTDRGEELPAAESTNGLNVVRVRAYPTDRDYYLAPGARAFLLHQQFDLAHVQGYHTAFAPLALRWLSQAGKPFVLSFHSGGARNAVRRLARPGQYAVIRRYTAAASALIAVSRFERGQFATWLQRDPSDIDLVRNGISEDLIAGMKGIERDPNLIVSPGRLERYKGHHRAIRALVEVRAHMPDARLRIVGVGTYEPELRSLALSLGLDQAVEFGVIPQGDRAGMGELLRRSAVAVFLSEYEAEGIGATEARVAGCRTVVTDSTALSELIDGDAVIGVRAGCTPSDIGRSIISALRAASAGPAPNHPPRTWSHVTDDIENIYSRILHGA